MPFNSLATDYPTILDPKVDYPKLETIMTDYPAQEAVSENESFSSKHSSVKSEDNNLGKRRG